MMDKTYLERFQNLDYKKFKENANNPKLLPNEKIGFPEVYRKGKDQAILNDIELKTGFLSQCNQVLDIGIGCGTLALKMVEACEQKDVELHVIDSKDMLNHLPDRNITKHPGFFPEMPEFLNVFSNYFDAVIVYSVFHYVFKHGDIYGFMDQALTLLRNGGTLLLGDIPNISLRKRFFQSEKGKAFHRKYTDSNVDPEVDFARLEPFEINDGIILGIVSRYRDFGFEAYILPQPPDLPMANRREDIVIVKH